ncbi:MAG: glycosyltransferase family 4 protein [Planctomycetes bacterium]|nr:glycosyltransferase family 4 protein [Planctomycetota bacterium]
MRAFALALKTLDFNISALDKSTHRLCIIPSMKIIYLVVSRNQAPLYYRVLQMVPGLAQKGIYVTVARIPSSFMQRPDFFKRLHEYDLVILQRKLFNWIDLHSLRAHAKKLVFDVDDALCIRDSASKSPYSLTRKIRFRRTVKRSDFVLCGNEWIRKTVAEFNINTAVVPTVVDLSRYEEAVSLTDNRSFTAVWIGSRVTLFYLENLLPELEPLAKKIKGFKIRVISDRFPNNPHIDIERIPWTRETEITALSACHVGLMPLIEDAWSRGKCGLKLIQYGAAGLPSICTPLGVNQDIVVHKETGFHASTPEEWRGSIEALARNPLLRNEMGKKAKDRISQDYSLSAHLEPYHRLLRKIAYS